MENSRQSVAHAALAIGLIAAVFTLVVCVLLTTTHIQLKKMDPLNHAALVALRDRYADGERDDQMKQDIRQLDLLARKAFFTNQTQIRAGGTTAIVAGVVMLIAFGIFQVTTRNVPPPKAACCDGMVWIELERSRVWVAGGTILLVAVAIMMVLSTPTILTEDLASPPPQPQPQPRPHNDPAPRPTVAVIPMGFAEHAPAFRGANGSGQTDFADVPTEWNEETGMNLLWKRPLELPAWASPVVWDDRVIALGADQSNRVVYCLNANTGEDTWTTVIPPHPEATVGYETDTMDERWDILVYAGATPAVNGTDVFALFSNGQLVALDLATGDVRWNIVPASTSANTYGLDSALRVYRNSVIVVFEGDERFIARYDAATGRELWKTERESSTWASPILAARDDGTHLLVLLADPDVTAWDPETGARVWTTDILTEEPDFCVGPSPVQAGDRVFVNCQNSGIYGVDLADGNIAWRVEELPDDSGFPDGTSMTTDGRYLYQFYESVLTCLDTANGQVVKQKELDTYSNYASAALNKGLLYLSTEDGMLILNADPETDFAVVGTGTITGHSDASPTFVKGRVFLRSDDAVICFGVTE